MILCRHNIQLTEHSYAYKLSNWQHIRHFKAERWCRY